MNKDGREGKGGRTGPFQGIVIAGAERGPAVPEPRIAAFIWGGKVRPRPVLPYGRWKGAA